MLSDERLGELDSLQKILGYKFKSIQLLNKALTHKSFVNENNHPIKNNERFEFLGDAVLDLLVSNYIVKEFPDYAEGVLSKIRAAVVNETCLAELARAISLGDFLLLGKGEHLSGGRNKNSLLANAYEATVGAVYTDNGIETAGEVFLPALVDKIILFSDTGQFQDFKSDLQEYTQNNLNCIPFYKVVNETGPDHDKIFEIAVMIRDKTGGKGSGRSKKEAEQEAAKIALDNFINKKDDSISHGA